MLNNIRTKSVQYSSGVKVEPLEKCFANFQGALFFGPCILH